MPTVIISDRNFHSENERASDFRYKDFNFSQWRSIRDPLVTDFVAVREKIHNWFTIPKGTWFRDYNLGSDLKTYLFEPLNSDTVGLIVEEIERVFNAITEVELVELDIDVLANEGRVNAVASIMVPSLSKEKYDLQIGLGFGSGDVILGGL